MSLVAADVFEKLNLGVVKLSSDGEVLELTSKATELTSYDLNDLKESGLSSIVIGNGPEGLTSGASIDLRIRKKNNSIHWINARILHEENFTYLYLTDINEAKIHEVELNRFYEIPNHFLCVLDENSCFKRMNKAFELVLGYRPEELLGQSIWTIVHPDDLGPSLATKEAAISVAIESFTNRLRAKDGRYFWIQWTGQIIDGINYGAGVDITKFKETEYELRVAADKFEGVTNAVPQIVWISDALGQTEYVNDRWFSLTGLDPNTYLSAEWPKVVHPDDQPAAVAAWMQCLETGEDYKSEYRIYDIREKEYRWYLATGIPLKGSQNKIFKWIGSCTDVHELKKAISARDEFLSIASHELKTPLTSICLYAELLLRRQDLDPEFVKKSLVKLLAQSTRMNRLIDDMLDVSRIRTGQLKVIKESVSFNEIMAEVHDRFDPIFEDRGIPFKVNCSESITGTWDKMRVEQILYNLLSNALKYGDNKPVELSAGLKDNNTLCLSIKDNGTGIKLESLEKIFGRFERDNQSREISGLGLGLFIVRQIVHSHDGKIYAKSDGPGAGSEFIVELPLNS